MERRTSRTRRRPAPWESLAATVTARALAKAVPSCRGLRRAAGDGRECESLALAARRCQGWCGSSDAALIGGDSADGRACCRWRRCRAGSAMVSVGPP